MDQFANKIYEVCTKLQPFAIALACLSFVVIGIMMIYPSQKTKEKAKDAVPWVAIGCAVCIGGITLGKWLGGIAAF